jgi:hypothetical protein
LVQLGNLEMKCDFCRKEAKFFAREKDGLLSRDLFPHIGLYICGECPSTSGVKDDDRIEVIPINEYIEKNKEDSN